eukprot:958380-Rhodomonas_salina.1
MSVRSSQPPTPVFPLCQQIFPSLWQSRHFISGAALPALHQEPPRIRDASSRTVGPDAHTLDDGKHTRWLACTQSALLCTRWGGAYRLDAHVDAHDAVGQRHLVRPLDRRAVRHGVREGDAHLDDLPAPVHRQVKSKCTKLQRATEHAVQFVEERWDTWRAAVRPKGRSGGEYISAALLHGEEEGDCVVLLHEPCGQVAAEENDGLGRKGGNKVNVSHQTTKDSRSELA